MGTPIAAPTASGAHTGPACVTCGTPTDAPVLSLPDLPVLVNEGWPSRAEALAAARGDVVLARCPGCGLMRNVDFRAELVRYSPRYENSLHHSPRFDGFARSLAADLVGRFDLVGGSVAEVGAGQGDFLRLLRDAGVAQVEGLDPASRDDGGGPVRGEAFGNQPLAADMVCARHVLEHVPDPLEFLRQLGRSVRPGTAFYLEVPNAGWMLQRGGVWDVIYEHCSYFDGQAFREVLDRAGFAVERLDTVFEDQFLAASGRIPGGQVPEAGRTPREVDDGSVARRFAEQARQRVSTWDLALRTRARRGERVVLWGAGSKGTTFLNLVPASDVVAVVVDVNPRKHGTHLPGTGHEVVAPDHLRDEPPDAVVVANDAYLGEIRAMLEELGVHADVDVP